MKRREVIVEGHFVLQSGRHSKFYVDKDRISLFPRLLRDLSLELAGRIAEQSIRRSMPVYAVIAPAIGAIPLGQWVAYHLEDLMGLEVKSIIAEKKGTDFVLRPKGVNITGLNLVVVEDILSTGDSAKRVIEAVRKANGCIAAVGSLWNRGGVTVEDVGHVPALLSLVDQVLPSYSEEECKTTGLCSFKQAINPHYGRGREYIEGHK